MTDPKIIRTEDELYSWLLQYMQQAGPRQLYPAPLVEFVERLLQEIPRYVDHDILIEILEQEFGGGEEGAEKGVVAALLHKVGVRSGQRVYSRQLVEFAAQAIIEACHAGLSTARANRCALKASGLDRRGYFAETGTIGHSYLSATRRGEKALGISVRVKQDQEVLGWSLGGGHIQR